MNFYSIQFLTFLVIALFGYYTILRKRQWICLLLASIVFYCFTGVENFIFLLLTGVTTWMGAKQLAIYSNKLSELRCDKMIEKEEKKNLKEAIIKKRHTIMWGVLLVNFGVLAGIKYLEAVLKGLGVIGDDNAFGIILPLGISFYTFQAIGYLVDVYNEKYDAERNFAKYMLFVSWFPQMIQGPINRFDVIREQFLKVHVWNEEDATKAMYRIFYGLIKKYAIANIFAIVISNTFDTPVKNFAGVTVVFSILLYSAQQYADFSGGIDMVLGISELFGIRMAENFRQPYFSVSLADFWRRWHISLGKWMRDYVFYPFVLTKPMKKFGKWANQRLGKHLGRVLPAAIGNILVFLIVGIWHGAEWHYVVFGVYNGTVIAMSDVLAPVYDSISKVLHINKKAKWYHFFCIIRTFLVVNIGWYFDRIADVKVALYSLKKSVLDFHVQQFKSEFRIIFDGIPNDILLFAVMACVLVTGISFFSEKKYDVRNILYRCPLGVRWCVYILAIGMVLLVNTYTTGQGDLCMRIFKKKGIQFLLLVCFLNVLISFLIEPARGASDTMWQEYYMEEELNLLFVGSSMCSAAFDPSVFNEKLGVKSFNMATPMQGINQNITAIRTALEEHDIDTIIMGMGFFVLQEEPFEEAEITFEKELARNKGGIEGIRKSLEYVFSEDVVATKKSLNYWFPWIYHKERYAFEEIQKNVKSKIAIAKGELKASESLKGYRPYNGYVEGEDRSSFNTYSQELRGEELKKFEKLLLLCKENNLDVIIVNTPHPDFDILSCSSVYEENTKIVKTLCEKYGADYYDFSLVKEKFFTDSEQYYYDFEHLNVEGSRVFCEMFCGFMEQRSAGEAVADCFYSVEEYFSLHGICE